MRLTIYLWYLRIYVVDVIAGEDNAERFEAPSDPKHEEKFCIENLRFKILENLCFNIIREPTFQNIREPTFQNIREVMFRKIEIGEHSCFVKKFKISKINGKTILTLLRLFRAPERKSYRKRTGIFLAKLV